MPLRRTVGSSSGVGEGFAMPRSGGSLEEMERALSVPVSRENQGRLYGRLARRAGVDLPPPRPGSWSASTSVAPPTALADRIGVPRDRLRPYPSACGRGGSPPKTGNRPRRRPSASRPKAGALDKLRAERRRGLEGMLEGWSPGDYDGLSHLFGRLARQLLRDDPEPLPAGQSSR